MQLALSGLDGIEQVRVLIPSQELRVTYDPKRIGVAAIVDAVRRSPAAGRSGNYDAVPLGTDGKPLPTPNP